ncbi:MAG: DUF7345 domain-containing protein [Halohasta sp.]
MNPGRQSLRLGGLICCLVIAVVAGSALVPGLAADSAVSVADGATPESDGSTVAQTNQLDSESVFAQVDDLETDRIRIDVDLREDGSARWTVEYWSELDDENTTAAFESLEEDVESDPEGYTADFADRISGTVSTAENATGREMSAEEFDVETDRQSVSREYGVVRYSFAWEGFARTDGDTLEVGDAIDGLFLDDGTRLLVSWPEEYELDSSTPEPDESRETAVIWRGGNTEFLSGEPRLTITPAAGGFGTGTIAVGLALAALVLGVAGWLLRQRSTDETPDAGPGAAASSATPSDDAAAATETPPTESTAESDDTPSTTAESADGETDSEPDPELLSNEEQVMRLLEANGGRMKQQTVVSELGWTDAKTSKVVSTLREEGEIESFRIGRENVLTIPDEDGNGLDL